MRLVRGSILSHLRLCSFWDLMRQANPEFAPFVDQNDFLEQVRNSNMWLFAEVGADLVGMVTVRGWAESWPEKVLGVYIIPAYRYKGLGVLLCLTAIQEAREMGLTKIRLHVNPSNGRAIKLYVGLGFHSYPETHNGEIVMRKDL